MQSGLKSLSKIFSETLLRIPDYQRGYAWENKQLKDFWNDIEQLPMGKSHYTGVLTLQPASDFAKWEGDIWIISSKHYSPLYVVDGQQRLTTAVILLQCILEKIDDSEQLNYTSKAEIRKKYIFESKDNGISRSYLFGYEKDNPSDEFLKRNIYGESSDVHSVLEETIYTKNLESAKKFFHEKLNELSGNAIEIVFTKLTQNFLFNIFYIEPELDVFVTFETMNNRGKLLSHLELLKNRLIYLSTKFEAEPLERETLRRAINESWKSVYHQLGRVESQRFNDDTFLHTHFFCYFISKGLKHVADDGSETEFDWGHSTRSRKASNDYLLEKYFTTKKINSGSDDQLRIKDIHEYAVSIKSVSVTYQCVANPTDDNCSVAERTCLQQLNRIGNFKLFLVSVVAFRAIKNKEKRVQMLRALERLGFLFRISPYLFHQFDINDVAIELITERLDSDSAVKKINEHTDFVQSTPDFISAFKRIGKTSGYYDWGAMQYFMYEYEQNLRALSKTSRQLLDWPQDDGREDYNSDHGSIEHIYPQQAGHAYWKDRFNRKYDVSQRNTLKNSIGNLLPVSHPKNSSLGNRSFPEKLGSADNQVGYRYGCLSEIQVSMEAEWTPVAILRRGLHLLNFIEKRWSLKLGSTEQKIDLLSLRFVVDVEGVDIDGLLNSKPPIPKAPKIS